MRNAVSYMYFKTTPSNFCKLFNKIIKITTKDRVGNTLILYILIKLCPYYLQMIIQNNHQALRISYQYVVCYLQVTRSFVRVGKFFKLIFFFLGGGGGEFFQVFGRIYAPDVLPYKCKTVKHAQNKIVRKQSK